MFADIVFDILPVVFLVSTGVVFASSVTRAFSNLSCKIIVGASVITAFASSLAGLVAFPRFGQYGLFLLPPASAALYAVFVIRNFLGHCEDDISGRILYLSFCGFWIVFFGAGAFWFDRLLYGLSMLFPGVGDIELFYVLLISQAIGGGGSILMFFRELKGFSLSDC